MTLLHEAFQFIYILGNVPHVYCMCDAYVIHVGRFWYITYVINTLLIHVLNTSNTIQYNTINNLYYAEYLTKLSLKGVLQV